jgi:HPt (histidine-containing phosphotransfer) domain-containing protein
MARQRAIEHKNGTRARVTTTGRGPVDMAHLAMQTLGDKGLEQEVLRLFEEASRVYMDRIDHSTSVDELVRHLHTLKGAAAGVGARAIAELARSTEDELRAGKPVDPERIEDLHMAIAECSEWIERVLPKDS